MNARVSQKQYRSLVRVNVLRRKVGLVVLAVTTDDPFPPSTFQVKKDKEGMVRKYIGKALDRDSWGERPNSWSLQLMSPLWRVCFGAQ